jgi:hypothetical protein
MKKLRKNSFSIEKFSCVFPGGVEENAESPPQGPGIKV